MPAKNRRPQTPKPRRDNAKRGNNGAEPRGVRYDRAKDKRDWK